ncbi:RagB/SusD family nutrient uptake outer membrane protein [Bacteroides acidifaciens]|uniref:RagB/SusD family nutrient uptake outer membrane protein n=1 Tax=Bacteroides acidifaciens TaxID=85831 RepID=UPI0020CA428D|nr:RagB/SusD family nutrient uptake outer membrane protein [Bacteroides acidifaciens]
MVWSFTAPSINNRSISPLGIPTIDVAWEKAAHPEKANTQDGLREIVRRERQIEFYLENHRFWDLRRWKQAEILGEKVKGLNIYGKTEEDFFQVKELNVIRTFKEAQYLMPIPQPEINKCPQWVQNPGY